MPRPDPEIKQEKVDVPEIPGGPVYVRAVPLSVRFRLAQGDDNIQSGLETLAISVVGEDGEPIWSIEQWDKFAGGHGNRFNELVSLSFRLADISGEEAKKPEGQS
jgi:hypothetical protein